MTRIKALVSAVVAWAKALVLSLRARRPMVDHLFQAAGLVLLTAMLGSIVLTLRHKPGVKRQDIEVQNARTAASAVTVRKVSSRQGV